MPNVIQRSFTGGELSPELYSRTDQSKYATGLKICRNFLIRPFGGVTNRPGFKFISTTKTPTTSMRLFPFIYSNNAAANNYLLVFGDLYLRLMQLGGVVTTAAAAYDNAKKYAAGELALSGGITYVCITTTTGNAPPNPLYWYAQPGTTFELPSPYAAADLARVQVVQSADVMTLTHPNYPMYELRRYAHTQWTLQPATIAPLVSTPTGAALGGGNAGVIYYYAITAISSDTGEESLAAIVSSTNRVPAAGVPTLVSWNGVPGAVDYNVYRSTDGVTYGYIGSYGGITTSSSKNVWVANTSTISTTVPSTAIEPAAGNRASMAVITAASQKPSDQQFTIMGRWKTTVTDNTRQASVIRIKVYYSRDGEPPVDAGYIYTTYTPDTGIFHSFSSIVVVPDNGYALLTLQLAPELTGIVTGAPVFGDSWQLDLDFTTAPDNQITWNGLGVISFSDPLLALDLTRRPPTQVASFNAVSSYPSAVGRYQQRLVVGNTILLPERIWASRIGARNSFTKSFPIAADDVIVWTQAGKQVNEIRHIIDLNKLIVLTSNGEWIVEGNQDGTLTPDAVNPKQISYNGSSIIPPVVVVNTVLFVQARGTIIRDLASEGFSNYKGNDLTLYASHLFEDYTLQDMAFQQIPNSIVWVVRSDGTLLGLTYVREQEVWGWHRHDTDGVIEQIAVVPETNEDMLYAVIKRTIGGVSVRYIERMESRRFTDVEDVNFLDSSLTYDGTNTDLTKTMTLSGGTTWDNDEQVTVTSSAALFTANNVGDAIFIWDDFADDWLRVVLEAYTSATVMTGRPERLIQPVLRNTALSSWGLAILDVGGLTHLEGRDVGVLGDGAVLASPIDDFAPLLTVVAGFVTLPTPCLKICIGLPYVSDLQTLDLDFSVGSTMKDRRQIVNRVTAALHRSRGIFAGIELPDADDSVDGLTDYQPRAEEDDYGLPPLINESVDIQIESAWDNNGRVAIRQPYPLPLTIISIAPSGYLTSSQRDSNGRG